MFTGIVEELGAVRRVDGVRLEVDCSVVPDGSPIGSSVAVSGVCLTVVDHRSDRLAFDLAEETVRRTTLGRLAAGHAVNLERPVSLAARLGGHIVQGHVDGVGQVRDVDRDGDGGARLRVDVPPPILRYAIAQGSIAIDGVSLTIASLHGDGVEVALIPHTLAVTTMGGLRPGSEVNLEADLVAKYVERLVPARSAPGGGTDGGPDDG